MIGVMASTLNWMIREDLVEQVTLKVSFEWSEGQPSGRRALRQRDGGGAEWRQEWWSMPRRESRSEEWLERCMGSRSCRVLLARVRLWDLRVLWSGMICSFWNSKSRLKGEVWNQECQLGRYTKNGLGKVGKIAGAVSRVVVVAMGNCGQVFRDVSWRQYHGD